MCELLGMNANVPTDICFSFTGLVRRGGQTGPHGDGWGISFYQGKGCRSFHDPESSARSKIAEFLRNYSIKSKIVVSHIRRANRGRVALENTHPFIRELWGRYWAFAHNGQLKGIKKLPLKHFQPVGTTDSEWAFCWLLDQLRIEFKSSPTDRQLFGKIAELLKRLHQLGIFNVLMSDGRFLFCYCSTDLAWITRRAPFGAATLVDEDLTVDFSRETTPDDVVTVIATRPLTRDERWHRMASGELIVFRDGEVVKRFSTSLRSSARGR